MVCPAAEAVLRPVFPVTLVTKGAAKLKIAGRAKATFMYCCEA